MSPYANEWLDFLARWLHVVAGIAWIGTSFYFVAVDNHLRSPEDPADARRGVAGEEWEIHGGGFYQVQKYRVAPPKLPDPLHWFKWEAYTTWLSGFALLIVLYYVNASTYLVDRSVADLTSTEAILISIGLLVVAWVVYDALCRAIPSQLVLAVAVIALTTVAAWGCSQLFSGRAAYVQVGAMLGTIMAANVFVVIIPAHHKLLRAMKEGREPDPAPGIRAKERSVHNNYLTLPVLFAMLSPHFPSTYGHSYSWLILVVMMLIGAWIRLYFNLRHVGYNAWPILVTAALAIAAVAIVIRPQGELRRHRLRPAVKSFRSRGRSRSSRSAACPATRRTRRRMDSPPLGITFDTPEQIKARADQIEQVAVESTVMPLGNATEMTAAERATLGAWIRQGAKIK